MTGDAGSPNPCHNSPPSSFQQTVAPANSVGKSDGHSGVGDNCRVGKGGMGLGGVYEFMLHCFCASLRCGFLLLMLGAIVGHNYR